MISVSVMNHSFVICNCSLICVCSSCHLWTLSLAVSARPTSLISSCTSSVPRRNASCSSSTSKLYSSSSYLPSATLDEFSTYDRCNSTGACNTSYKADCTGEGNISSDGVAVRCNSTGACDASHKAGYARGGDLSSNSVIDGT